MPLSSLFLYFWSTFIVHFSLTHPFLCPLSLYCSIVLLLFLFFLLSLLFLVSSLTFLPAIKSSIPSVHSSLFTHPPPPPTTTVHSLFLCLIRLVSLNIAHHFYCNSCFSGSNKWQLTFSSQDLGLKHILYTPISRKTSWKPAGKQIFVFSFVVLKLFKFYCVISEKRLQYALYVYNMRLICRTAILFGYRERAGIEGGDAPVYLLFFRDKKTTDG